MCPGFESRTSDLGRRSTRYKRERPLNQRQAGTVRIVMTEIASSLSGIRDSRERPALDRQEGRESMKDKFLKAFRTDLERYCDHMSHEAKENILSFGLPTRLYSRWMGMLDMAVDLKIIDFQEYLELSNVVMLIRNEAVESARFI